MFKLSRFFGHPEIDQWRDDYTLLAAATLNDLASRLIADADKELEAATWKDGLVGQSSFIERRIATAVRDAAAQVADHMIATANRRLSQIVAHEAVLSLAPKQASQGPDTFEGWQDVAAAAAPLAGGAALAAALPGAAITTTTAWFGLVTATTISWPVVLGGGAVVGVAVATGALNTARIWDKTEARLRRKVREFIIASLILGTDKQPSVLQQVTRVLADAAEHAKKL